MNKLLFLIIIVSFVSCDIFKTEPEIASVPIIYFDFDGNSKSTGIENFRTLGNQKLNYSLGIKDSCLNLSINSLYRKPVILNTRDDIMLNQQQFLSVIVWIKKDLNDQEQYGIIGNKGIGKNDEKGWLISTSENGSWKLELSDGSQYWEYNAQPQCQRINDNRWHQIGFVLDKTQMNVRTYFDGKHMAVIGLNDLKELDPDHNLHIGCAPNSYNYSMEAFNGYIDEVGIWTKQLSDIQMSENFLAIKQEKVENSENAGETFKVLTWNIWNGGKQQGKIAGVKQIVNIIKKSGADVIALQEELGSGEYIADLLNFKFYKISENLCLISRFPIGSSYHIYKPINAGGAEIILDDQQSVIVCPIWLSYSPNIKGLLVNPEIQSDTIIDIEEKTRGSETKFIISEINRFYINKKDNPLIFAGDFNSGSHLDWTLKNLKNKYNKVIEFPSTKKLEENGFKDAYREIWPDETNFLGNTYSPIFTEGYKDRIDFIYYKGKAIKPVDAKIIDKSISFFPSDHAAVLVTFIRN